MSLFLNGVETNKVMWNGIETTGVWNGEVVWGVPAFKTLTLYHSEGGTLTANELTGYPGDTINLSTAYNTYWRFSGYQLTGDGTLVGNDYTFGSEDATICACYKVNAFTATGTFEKGSNVTAGGKGDNPSYNNVGSKYAIRNASTGDIPASWYSTSNRWNPSNASAYKITLNPKLSINFNWGYSYNARKAWATACSYVGSTRTQAQSTEFNSNNVAYGTYTARFNYSKNFTSTTQGTYSISARFGISRVSIGSKPAATATYLSTATTGSWTATGYAP